MDSQAGDQGGHSSAESLLRQTNDQKDTNVRLISAEDRAESFVDLKTGRACICDGRPAVVWC
ncbi:protein of unknown function [Paraburkholderia dioscoreae]|uniref:Uncharacterized protein n=1 Tax=Paraburkholderia dioscoreae TaxID=2604047 RepID=A0A5Q4Z336_9BURK|nr:protein of unknown function [Paraburkholderia dioscoreae]